MSDAILARGAEPLDLSHPAEPQRAAEPLVAAPAITKQLATVRSFTAEDAVMVARLFRNTFGYRGGATPTLQTYLVELFLNHPWFDPALASRVFVDAAGEVRGFIGILPVRMSFRGRPVLAAAAGSLMVENPARDPLAGARLLRTYFSGPQELSFSETSNPLSQTMWEKLGGTTFAGYSMEWLRLFRPAGTAVALLSQGPFARLMHPIAALADRAFNVIAGSPFQLSESETPHVRSVSIDAPAFGALVQSLATQCALRPEWSGGALAWQLQHAVHKERYGEIVCAAVLGRNDELLGCYAFHGRPRGVAVTLQIMARPTAMGAVVDQLFYDAQTRGCAGVRGRSFPALLNALLLRRCILLHRSSLTARSADPQLMEAIRNGDALMIGLAGESWTRLIGGVAG